MARVTLHCNLLLVGLVRGGAGLDAARPLLDLDLLPRPQARQVRAQVLQVLERERERVMYE